MNNVVVAAKNRADLASVEYEKWANIHAMKAQITLLVITALASFFIVVEPFMVLFLIPAVILRAVYMAQEHKRLKEMKKKVELSQRLIRQLAFLQAYNLAKMKEINH